MSSISDFVKIKIVANETKTKRLSDERIACVVMEAEVLNRLHLHYPTISFPSYHKDEYDSLIARVTKQSADEYRYDMCFSREILDAMDRVKIVSAFDKQRRSLMIEARCEMKGTP